MQLLNTSSIILLCLFGCTSLEKYTGRTNWDQNRDDRLSRHEFVTGYSKSNYFLKWGKGRSISSDEFISGIFYSIDSNQDKRLSRDEFERKIGQFYFWQFTEDFHLWDDDKDEVLTLSEFGNHATRTSLIDKWDSSADDKVNEHELSAGMFHLCDVDNDNFVNSLEFAIWKIHR